LTFDSTIQQSQTCLALPPLPSREQATKAMHSQKVKKSILLNLMDDL
jgi:hypothetical protein